MHDSIFSTYNAAWQLASTRYKSQLTRVSEAQVLLEETWPLDGSELSPARSPRWPPYVIATVRKYKSKDSLPFFSCLSIFFFLLSYAL